MDAEADDQPQDQPHAHAVAGELFSLLAELAKDPANGLTQVRPGVYIGRKDSAALLCLNGLNKTRTSG